MLLSGLRSTHLPADRLLLQRLRKSQSGTALYGDTPAALEDVQEPAGYQSYPLHQGGFSHRLIVVANRLPVSATRGKSGAWELQARPHTSDTVYSPLSQMHSMQKSALTLHAKNDLSVPYLGHGLFPPFTNALNAKVSSNFECIKIWLIRDAVSVPIAKNMSLT